MRRTVVIALAALAAASTPAAAAPSGARMACRNGDADVGRTRPAACVVLGLGLGDSGYFDLRALRWSSWGAPAATARGNYLAVGFETGTVRRIAVRVTLTRPRRGCDGRRWYTRIRITDATSGFVMRLPTCPGRRG